MSPLDEDWVDEDDYDFDEGQDDFYEENLHEYLTRLDAPDREVLVEHLSEPIFINVPRVVNSVNSVDAIVPVLEEQEVPGGDPFSGFFLGPKNKQNLCFSFKSNHIWVHFVGLDLVFFLKPFSFFCFLDFQMPATISSKFLHRPINFCHG